MIHRPNAFPSLVLCVVGTLPSHCHSVQLLRKKDYPDGKFTLAFVGYGDETENTVIELTHNWETDNYDLGNAYGHIALEVDDVYKSVDAIKRQGGKILREAGPMNAGSTIIAFVEDPDGYQIELLAPKT